MLASFSGIGGSGKTTQLREAARQLRAQGRHVEIFALRDLFLWPRLVGILRARGTSGIPRHAPAADRPPAGLLKHAVRAAFYLADAWRIHLLALRPASRRGLAIADRSFPDFAAELALDRRDLDVPVRLFLRLCPRPDAAFWFDLPAETAIARKREVPLDELLRHQDMYRQVMARVSRIAVDAGQPAPAIQRLLLRILSEQASGIDAEGLLLLSEPGDLGALGDASWRGFLRRASRNRMLLRGLMLLAAAPGAQERYRDAYVAADERARLAGNADDHLDDYRVSGGTAVPFKEGHGIELGSDLDAVLPDRAALAGFRAWAAERGRVEEVSEDKADAFLSDALPIDAHVGMTFSGFRYLSSREILDHPREAEALALIAHAASELTLVTAGDLLKIASLGDLDDATMRAIAARNGWEGLLAWWQGAAIAERLGYRLPYAIPAWRLLWWRLRRYAFRMDGDPVRDFLMLARAVRARWLGHVPYHEPWHEIA